VQHIFCSRGTSVEWPDTLGIHFPSSRLALRHRSNEPWFVFPPFDAAPPDVERFTQAFSSGHESRQSLESYSQLPLTDAQKEYDPVRDASPFRENERISWVKGFL
jgi:hypothetical protein